MKSSGQKCYFSQLKQSSAKRTQYPKKRRRGLPDNGTFADTSSPVDTGTLTE